MWYGENGNSASFSRVYTLNADILPQPFGNVNSISDIFYTGFVFLKKSAFSTKYE